MKRLLRQLRSYWEQFLTILCHELRIIFTDAGVMLILLFALLIYSTIYACAYAPEVVRRVPIGVIDQSHTATSRRLIAQLDASANLAIAYEPSDMEEAKRLFYARRIYGVVYIPADYEASLYAGEQATLALYADASYMLIYRQIFEGVATTVSQTGGEISLLRALDAGLDTPPPAPIIYQNHTLFNPYLGYATFLMPAVILTVIQQTLLIGVGMIGGTWREERLYRALRPKTRRRISTLPLVVGRGVTYLLLYALTGGIALAILYPLFGYPMKGALGAVVCMVGLYTVACIALALALSTLFCRREESLLLLLWTSIPILLLSGVSFPKEGMPDWLYRVGLLLPSSHGIEGFVRIQTMGASLSEVFSEVKALLLLTLLYGGLACLSTHRIIRKEAS